MADGPIMVVLAISTVAVALGQGIPPNPSVSSEAWGSYRSERGHFSLEHPAGWSAAETVDARGALVATFTAPSGGRIAVIVQRGSSFDEATGDFGNVHCHAVTVDGRAARACLDTVSSSLSTTVAANGMTYVISGNRRRSDQRTYDRVVASFRILP